MPNLLVIDFETRSRVDISVAGGDKYCQDLSTGIICMGLDFTDSHTSEFLWTPGVNPSAWMPMVREHIANGGLICAHNARFDQQIWEYIAVEEHGFPEIPADQWYCTAAQARVNALPSSLDGGTRALNAKHRKNHAGTRLIRKLCIPDKMGNFNYDPQLLDELYRYCLDDVRATIDLMTNCRLMSPDEHADWLANERINDRGIRIDRPLAVAASNYAAEETEAIGLELAELTGGEVTKHTQNQRIKKWVLARVSKEVEKLTVTYKDGVRKNSLAKDIRAKILDMADAFAVAVPDDVYNVIAALDDGNKSSVSKFKRMVERADEETDRVHGAFMYAGAATLRYTSRGLQLHNFRRDCASEAMVDELRPLMVSGNKLGIASVMDTLSKLLRPTIIPAEGKVFVVNDWSAIENRALPWLADDPAAEGKLQMFRDGIDTYIRAAADAGTDNRQVGKVIELSLGYGGANGAFLAMARNYGVYLPDHEITRIVKQWRVKNAWAVDFWDKLERAAVNAVKHPGEEFTAGRIKYTFVSNLMGGSLLCEMPGKHFITYPQARLEILDGPYGPKRQLTALKANWTPAADDTEWPRYRLWRGLLAENVTQAFCAALLRYIVRECPNIVLHCHDEVCLEVPEQQAEKWAIVVKQLMETPPEWAKGLPLTAKPSIMRRYGK